MGWKNGRTSLGEHALLVFALPQSHMAQPLGCNCRKHLSALVGISINHWIYQSLLATQIATMLSILVMFVFCCIHPLVIVVALVGVLGKTTGFRYASPPSFLWTRSYTS